jgi:cytochrome c
MKIRYVLAAAPFVLSVQAAFAGGDPVAGAAVFKKCAVCHTATAPENHVGPSLMGVVGRRVATAPDYHYSPAMQAFGADGKVWDEALLHKYLPSPQFLVKGTKMTFPGLRSDKDIDNVIAYLKNPAAAQ